MPKFQCAMSSAERDESLFATASQVSRWLLVELRGSWGRDSVVDTDLGRHVTSAWRARMQASGVRVIAIRRDLDRSTDRALKLFFVETGRLPHPRGRTWQHDIAGLHAVAEATEALPVADDATGWSLHREWLVLVCTNGRHDSCCATFGRPIVRTLRESAHADAVWECSHIGGDRFAGNIVVLPQGLFFGRCDPAESVGIVDDLARGRIRLPNFRGRSTLGFTQQAAEHFVRRELGLDGIDSIVAIRRVGEAAEGVFAVEVADNGTNDTVVVTLRRSVSAAESPLTCTGPTGMRVPSYEVVDLHR